MKKIRLDPDNLSFEITQKYLSKVEINNNDDYPTYSLHAKFFNGDEQETVGYIRGYYFEDDEIFPRKMDDISVDLGAISGPLMDMREHYSDFERRLIVTIDEVRVYPQFRGQGVAKAMLTTLIEDHFYYGILILYPIPLQDSKITLKRLRELYISVGFKKVPLKGHSKYYFLDAMYEGEFK